MRNIFFLAAFTFTLAVGHAQTPRFKKAQSMARTENKLVLLNFSGSDWCQPCMRLEQQVFSDRRFQQFAQRSLVLVHADFPRRKSLPQEIAQENAELAVRYNTSGYLPTTLLMTSDGRILKAWNGFAGETANDFIDAIKRVSVQDN